MNIQTVRAKGFIGVKDGMGLDELFVDFSHMTGLIGITGPTGMGKSTLLELAQPYPYMVSRSGALSRHVFFKDSFKEVTFMHNGDHFKNLIKVNAESGKSEGYVYVNQEGSDNPVSLTSTISEYKAFMDKTFGSFKLFSSSAFFAQNSDGPTSLGTADLRALFREVIGEKLQRLDGYSETCKRAARSIESKVALVVQDIDRQSAIVLAHSNASASLVLSREEKKSTEALITEAEAALGVRCSEMEALQSLSLQRDVDLRTRGDLRERIEGLKKEADNIRVELLSYTKDYEKAVFVSDTNIRETKDLLKGREDIEGAADQVTELIAHKNSTVPKRAEISHKMDTLRIDLTREDDADRAAYTSFAESHEADRVRYLEVKAAVDGTEDSIKSLSERLKAKAKRVTIQALEVERDRCADMAKDLDRRGSVAYIHPADGKHMAQFPCNSEDCIYIKKALDAEKRIPELTKAVEEAEAENIKDINAFVNSIGDATLELEILKKDLDKAEGDGKARVTLQDDSQSKRNAVIDTLRFMIGIYMNGLSDIDVDTKETDVSITYHTDLAAKLPDIKVAGANLESLKAAAETLRVDGEERTKTDTDRIASKDAKIGTIQEDINNIDRATDPDLDMKVTSASVNIRLKEGLIKDLREQLRGIDLQSAILEENVLTADKAAKETNRLIERRQMLSEHNTGFVYLQNKTGPRGIQALIIDAVAPQIKDDANMLLSSAFGPGAIVDWDTIDENGKEILEPMVINAEGVKVPLDYRSGGQKQLARRAIACGMAILANNEAGFGYDTAFFDEKDDGLDVEAAINFTRMFGAFLEYGKFEKGLFVSHKPGCVDVADHVIELGKGGIQ